MAENKKSFIAYSDWHDMFRELPDEIAGKLIKHIFAYVNDEDPKTDDWQINSLFANVKSTLKRDLKKWEQQREQRVLAGKRSAEIRATKFNERSTDCNETERNSTVSVSDSVNVLSKDNKDKFDLSFVDTVYLSLVRDFIKYRSQLKKPFKTERGVKKFYNELIELSKNNFQKATELIEHAKDKEWLTVYKIKENGKQTYTADDLQRDVIQKTMEDLNG